MQIITQDERRLVLREKPTVFWLNAVLFAFLAGLLWYGEVRAPIVITLVGLSLAMAFLPGVRTFTIEVEKGLFVLATRRIWGEKRREIPLAEVADVECYQPERMKRIAVLNLILKSDKRITLADAGRINSFPQVAEVMRAYLARSSC